MRHSHASCLNLWAIELLENQYLLAAPKAVTLLARVKYVLAQLIPAAGQHQEIRGSILFPLHSGPVTYWMAGRSCSMLFRGHQMANVDGENVAILQETVPLGSILNYDLQVAQRPHRGEVGMYAVRRRSIISQHAFVGCQASHSMCEGSRTGSQRQSWMIGISVRHGDSGLDSCVRPSMALTLAGLALPSGE